MRLQDNGTFRGLVSEVDNHSISLNGGDKLDLQSIKWIKKSKVKTGEAILGILFAIGGTALLIHVAGDVNFDSILPLGATGVGLFSVGIIIAAPPKFKPYRGDQLTYTE